MRWTAEDLLLRVMSPCALLVAAACHAPAPYHLQGPPRYGYYDIAPRTEPLCSGELATLWFPCVLGELALSWPSVVSHRALDC